MNEWQLQKVLRKRWLAMGAVIDDEPHFLAGWEVMTNWEVNDAHRRWDLPSADFVFLDRHGRLAVLELKLGIRSPRESVLALCQVTHCAFRLAQTFTPERLAHLSAACRGGHNCGPQSDPVGRLHQAHADFFSLSAPAPLKGNEVKRAVAARHFGPAWPSTVEFFTATPIDELRAHLESRYRLDARGNRPMKRFMDLPNRLTECSPEVSSIQV